MSNRLAMILAATVLWFSPARADGAVQEGYLDFYFAHFYGGQPLPHLREEPQKTFFERLIDRGFIEKIVAADRPVIQKIRDVDMILALVGEARASYNYQVALGEPLQQELTEIQIFTLYLVDVAAKLVTEGGRPASVSWFTTYSGVVHSLSEYTIYSADQRQRLAEALFEYYPALRPQLGDSERKELLASLARAMAGESDDHVKAVELRLLKNAKGIE